MEATAEPEREQAGTRVKASGNAGYWEKASYWGGEGVIKDLRPPVYISAR